jgi:hypothetical protein
MLSSGVTCYHLGLHVIIWDAMLSSGANVIIGDKMLSSGANDNGIIRSLCNHLVLSCDVIIWDDNTPLFLFFLKTSLTRYFAREMVPQVSISVIFTSFGIAQFASANDGLVRYCPAMPLYRKVPLT